MAGEMPLVGTRPDQGFKREASAMPSRRFPKPWTVEPMPSGYRVTDANPTASSWRMSMASLMAQSLFQKAG
jgi:hypothetical protein